MNINFALIVFLYIFADNIKNSANALETMNATSHLQNKLPIEQQPWYDAVELRKRVIAKNVSSITPTTTLFDITVITVVYNAISNGRKDTLIQCMDTVQSQQGVLIEHVIVDGASNDGTQNLVLEYANTAHPIFFLSMKDSGIYDAMNRGLILARGKYVTFLNSDDFYHDLNGLSDSFHKLEITKCTFSFAPIRVVDDCSPNPHTCPELHLEDIIRISVISHQSLLVNREVMLQMHGFDVSYKSAADYDFLLRMILTGHQGCFVEKSFVSYRMTGLSSTNIDLSQHETADVLMHLYNKYLGTHLTFQEAYRMHCYAEFPANDPELRMRILKFVRHSLIDIPWTHLCDKIVGLQCRIEVLNKKCNKRMRVIRIGIYIIVLMIALVLVLLYLLI